MKFCFLILFSFFSVCAKAQQDEEEIKNAINTFFDGMESNDTAKIRTTLDNTCFLKTIYVTPKGETLLAEDSIEDFFTEVIKAKGIEADEQLLSFEIKIDGAMAIAWAPYKIFFNKKFSHCGVNVFTMIKRGSAWKILGITDTRRKQDCN